MKKEFKIIITFFISIMICVGIIPTCSTLAASNIFYIRSNYTSESYLYEYDGVLRYGIPTSADASFQWQLEEIGSNKVIKNLATNHYISFEGHRDASVEGSFADPIVCLPWEEDNDTFIWNTEPGEAQNIISASGDYSGYALHLEGVSDGQVRGQKLESDQLQWGNMLWDFVEASEIDFSSMIGTGFCIQNAEDGSYLRVDNGILTYGNPDGPDNAYIWIVEEQENGRKTIKNKHTSQYITMANYREENDSLGLEDLKEGDESYYWDFQIASNSFLFSADSNFDGYGVFLERVSKGKAKCDKIVSRNDFPSAGMKWNFIQSANVSEVAGSLTLDADVYNLKNSWFAMYLMEDNGVAVYGNAKSTDTIAQWNVIYDEKSQKTALRNEETGHYLYMKTNTQELVCGKEEIYYWNLRRSKNALYPNAVIFQDSESADRYLHMENLTGYIEDSNAVQPTWGTPHWVPIKVEMNETLELTQENFVIPTGYLRLQSSSNEGEYLYENSAGAVVYGVCEENDARSHWEFAETDTKDYYLLRNREYQHIVINQGNGMLRCVTEEDEITEGGLWQISYGGEENGLLINNAFSDQKPYLRPYINIQKLNGFAQSSLVSIEENSSKWIYEEALEEVVSIAKKEEAFVPLKAFLDTNLYQIVCDGVYLKNTYQLEYYGKRVRIIDKTTGNYLFYNDGWDTKSIENESDSSVVWAAEEKFGVKILTDGTIKLKLEKIPTDAIYQKNTDSIIGDEAKFTVYTKEPGTYKIGVGYHGSNNTLSMKVNGINQGRFDFKKDITLMLNKGINTISVSDGLKVTEIVLYDSINKNYRGASLPYIEYQAEDCKTTGTILTDNRIYRDISSEASGRSAVKLDGTGEYIKFTLTEPANSLVIRYCLPDSEDGIGLDATLNLYIDGIKTKNMELTSRYSWVYGNYPWTNQPSDGQAHHFYDDIRILLDKTYPAGTVFKLQKDAANMAKYYIIDTIELEAVADPLEEPENALSITGFGAAADDGKDDTEAFAKCLEEAIKQEKEVWIPAGTFEINTPTKDYDAGDNTDKNRGFVLTENNIVIRGAGMWHSVLSGEFAAFFIKGNNISFYDFSLKGTATSRRDAIDPSAIETDYSTQSMENITVQNIWIEHYKTGIWTHNMNGMHVVGCRIRNTFADGINLRRGTTNTVIEQCDVRNTGDDAMALWSSEYSDKNNSIRFNTVSLQWLANNISLYGGTDIEVVDNILRDTVAMGAGINISTNFNPQPFEGTITVARNTLERCGSHDLNYNRDNGAIWFNTVAGNDNQANVIVKDNLILDSTYQGVSFMNRGMVGNVLLEGNVIDGCGSSGIDIASGAKGNVLVRNSLIRNVMLNEINNEAESTFILTSEIIENEAEDKMPSSSSQKNTWYIVIIVIGAFISIGVIGLMIMKEKTNKGR